MKLNTKQLARMGVLSALSLVLMFLVRFPIIPAAPFLEYEPADVPILIAAFLYGPVPGFVMTVVVSLIQAMTVSVASGWIGALMHVISTGAFAIAAGLIYKKKHTFKGAILGLSVGALISTSLMVGLNLIFTPIFMRVPVEVVKDMLVPAIIPFNLLKGLMNSALVCLVYKPVGRILKNEEDCLPVLDRTEKG
jgi:riboflavin transporter FmnP